jgi:hypothetical protein
MTAVIIHIDLDAIDKRLDHGKLWTTGWGDWTDANASTCLHGAIRACQPVPGDAFIVEQVGKRYGFGPADNDDADSWEEIKAKVITDITDDMLAITFGPQWQQIVTLIRRAAVLTRSEKRQLAAAWRVITDHAKSSAWNAAGNAFRAEAIAAAHSAAWCSQQDTATGAASRPASTVTADAAMALVVRDLIGQHGFGQHHYETLTRPWATVIGKVHPDDKGSD